jgi:hypothetical protein
MMNEPRRTGWETAEAIARVTGKPIKIIKVKMVGTQEVNRFIRLIMKAQRSAHKVNLKLD